MAFDKAHERFLAFFSQDVLAPYRERPERYVCRSDNFEGEVTVTSEYYESLDEKSRDEAYLEVKFGYRTLKNGELCIAIFIHDLTEKSTAHIAKWAPFAIENGDWIDYDEDTRFSLFYRRYAEGDWDVENGPAFQLVHEIELINGLTLEAIGMRLYDVDEPPITFPAAENTWRYEDAHVSPYAILIDGLNLDCIRTLGLVLGNPLDPEAKRKPRALKAALPSLKGNASFEDAIDRVSIERGNAAHRVRPPAKAMKAFDQFSKELAWLQ